MIRSGIMALALVAGMSFPGHGMTERNEVNYYPATGIVTEIDMASDAVYWSDGINRWSFCGVEDWMIGDGVSVIMSDEGTESIYDDRMVGSPRYWNPDLLRDVME